MTPNQLVNMSFFNNSVSNANNLKMKFITLFNMKIALWDEMLDVNIYFNNQKQQISIGVSRELTPTFSCRFLE